MSLHDALQDAKTELLQGGPALSIIDSIAADYGINPALLARKFSESFGDPETFKDRAETAAEAVGETEAAFKARGVKDRAERQAYARREQEALASFFLDTAKGRAALRQIIGG